MMVKVAAVLATVLVIGCSAATLDFFSQTQSGDGTYYGSTTNGACTLGDGGVPPSLSGYLQVAMNSPQFANSEVCGMCLMVTGNGTGSGANPITGTFMVYVGDLCPECGSGALDLAKQGDGRWKISWYAVDCPVGSANIQYLFQGSNTYYIKIQARNTRLPVKSIGIKQGNTIKNLVRQEDNFFTDQNNQVTFPLDYSSLTVQVTSIDGQVLTDTINAVGKMDGPVVQGSVQFAAYKPGATTSASTGTTASASTATTTTTTTTQATTATQATTTTTTAQATTTTAQATSTTAQITDGTSGASELLVSVWVVLLACLFSYFV